jgi:hypothetical protein
MNLSLPPGPAPELGMILLTASETGPPIGRGVPPDLLSVGIFLPTIANGHSVGLSAFDDALSIDPDGPVDDRHGIDHNRSSCLDYGILQRVPG